jgi:hypothetical protein
MICGAMLEERACGTPGASLHRHLVDGRCRELLGKTASLAERVNPVEEVQAITRPAQVRVHACFIEATCRLQADPGIEVRRAVHHAVHDRQQMPVQCASHKRALVRDCPQLVRPDERVARG